MESGEPPQPLPHNGSGQWPRLPTAFATSLPNAGAGSWWRKEYTDEGASGANDDRPAFQRLLDDAFAGRFQVILFHKLDRFSRSISDILYYFNELESNDILICSATEAFDFFDPAKFHNIPSDVNVRMQVGCSNTLRPRLCPPSPIYHLGLQW